MSDFEQIAPEELDESAFRLIGKDWMLITAGTLDSFNMMTGGWGGLGVMWGRNVCFCMIRPQRYTRQFMEKSDFFTVSFFGEEHRAALEYCGSHSGRDVDKTKATGLTPVRSDSGAVYFAEARIVLECRKTYFQDIDPANFVDPTIADNYPARDYHRMYVGQIVKCMVSQ
jgi:flavin reductase (DIM6/NTAB) family NADH-FMN oxidoreductase RutF